MKILVDIDRQHYSHLEMLSRLGLGNSTDRLLLSGNILPDSHGDLIDRDELELDTEWDDYYDGFTSYSEMQIKNAEVIIEGDKEE